MLKDEKIPPKMMHSVRRNVRECKKKNYAEKIGMEMTGIYQDLEGFAKQRSISQAVRAHNDAQIPIGLHDFFVLSYCSNSKDDLHMAFTTLQNLFNWCRAYNSGHPVCL